MNEVIPIEGGDPAFLAEYNSLIEKYNSLIENYKLLRELKLKYRKLLCDAMNALDEDFVPGPKLADLENRFHALTGLHRGDEV